MRAVRTFYPISTLNVKLIHYAHLFFRSKQINTNICWNFKVVRYVCISPMCVGGGIGMGNTCKSMLIHVTVWQKSLQYCKVVSLQLIKINEKKKPYVKSAFISPCSQHIQSSFLFLMQSIFKKGSAFTVSGSDSKSKFSFPLIQFSFNKETLYASIFIKGSK